MRNIIWLLCIGLIAGACAPKVSVEDEMYSCLEEEYKAIGIDLNSALNELEAQMIAEDILIGSGGLAKKKYYEGIAKTGKIPSVKNTVAISKFLKLKFDGPLISKCLDKVKAKYPEEFAGSSLNKKLNAIQGRVAKLGAVTPANVAKAISMELEAKDFEGQYFRAMVLLTFAMTTDKETAYTRKIPVNLEKNNVVESTFKDITIRLGKTDQVLLNGISYDINDLDKAYFRLRKELGADCTVRFEVHSYAPYGNFTKVQDVIENYSKQVRSEEAKASFNVPYENLTPHQKNEVDRAHPMRLIESKFQ